MLKSIVFQILKLIKVMYIVLILLYLKITNLIIWIEFDGRQHFDRPDAKWKQSYSKEEI